MDPLQGIVVTSREIYDAVVRLTGRVDVLIEKQEHGNAVSQDHEMRIRLLERSRWPLHSLSAVIALSALAFSFFTR